jgi:hypothetical protein
MDRRKVRAEFERRFTAERMAASHIAAYRVLLARASANTKIMKLPVAVPAAPELLPSALGTNGGGMRHFGLEHGGLTR